MCQLLTRHDGWNRQQRLGGASENDLPDCDNQIDMGQNPVAEQSADHGAETRTEIDQELAPSPPIRTP